MQHLSHSSRRHQSISGKFCAKTVRFFALHQSNHMLHRLVRPPSIHRVSLTLRAVSCGRLNALVPEATPQGHNPSRYRLRRGLPWVSNPVAPHAAPGASVFVRGPPSPPVFLQIQYVLHRYTEFLPLYETPLASIRCSSKVEPGDFMTDLTNRLRFTPSNRLTLLHFRITASLGTELGLVSFFCG